MQKCWVNSQYKGCIPFEMQINWRSMPNTTVNHAKSQQTCTYTRNIDIEFTKGNISIDDDVPHPFLSLSTPLPTLIL